MNKEYIPKPFKLDHISLPEGLEEIMELMARNIHDIWAMGRIEEGWTKGPMDPVLKRHPMLVDYDELPESEKDFDRNTALATIRFIIAQGFEIHKVK
jgi:hypothetical protein